MIENLGAPAAVLGRVAVTTTLFYVTMFVVLRIGGRRTLAQFSAFDFVVTVAMGSLLASTALSPEPTYSQGVVALVSLVAAQTVVAAVRQRSNLARRFLDFAPEVIARDGELILSTSPWRAQLTRDEVRSLLRKKGIFDVGEVDSVILEPGGGISVVGRGTRDVDEAALLKPE